MYNFLPFFRSFKNESWKHQAVCFPCTFVSLESCLLFVYFQNVDRCGQQTAELLYGLLGAICLWWRRTTTGTSVQYSISLLGTHEVSQGEYSSWTGPDASKGQQLRLGYCYVFGVQCRYFPEKEVTMLQMRVSSYGDKMNCFLPWNTQCNIL